MIPTSIVIQTDSVKQPRTVPDVVCRRNQNDIEAGLSHHTADDRPHVYSVPTDNLDISDRRANMLDPCTVDICNDVIMYNGMNVGTDNALDVLHRMWGHCKRVVRLGLLNTQGLRYEDIKDLKLCICYDCL